MIKITDPTGKTVEFEDLTGKHLGQVTVLSMRRISSFEPIWNCLCDCGRHCVFGSYSLLTDESDPFKRKGCYFHEAYGTAEQTAIRRGMYTTWLNMKKRCIDEGNPAYKNYGGRGIYVCDEWLNNFSAFYEYVQTLDHYGEPGRSLDRIDNDDGYRPGNIRWATKKEQANNTRRTKNARNRKQEKESEPRSNQPKASL